MICTKCRMFLAVNEEPEHREYEGVIKLPFFARPGDVVCVDRKHSVFFVVQESLWDIQSSSTYMIGHLCEYVNGKPSESYNVCDEVSKHIEKTLADLGIERSF